MIKNRNLFIWLLHSSMQHADSFCGEELWRNYSITSQQPSNLYLYTTSQCHHWHMWCTAWLNNKSSHCPTLVYLFHQYGVHQAGSSRYCNFNGQQCSSRAKFISFVLKLEIQTLLFWVRKHFSLEMQKYIFPINHVYEIKTYLHVVLSCNSICNQLHNT